MTSREQFEQWAAEKIPSVFWGMDDRGEYKGNCVQIAWEAWKASRESIDTQCEEVKKCMGIEMAKWVIVQEYDRSWPDDLRSAGQDSMAEWLETVISRMIKGGLFSAEDDKRTIDLAMYMQSCVSQRDGS